MIKQQSVVFISSKTIASFLFKKTCGPSRKAMEWYKKNPWFLNKYYESMTAYAYYLDHQSRDKGFIVDTDEYYEYIDQNIHQRYPDYFESKPIKKIEEKVRSLFAKLFYWRGFLGHTKTVNSNRRDHDDSSN